MCEARWLPSILFCQPPPWWGPVTTAGFLGIVISLRRRLPWNAHVGSLVVTLGYLHRPGDAIENACKSRFPGPGALPSPVAPAGNARAEVRWRRPLDWRAAWRPGAHSRGLSERYGVR